MEKMSKEFAEILSIADQQGTVNVINRVSMHLFFPMLIANEDDSSPYGSCEYYESPSRKIFVVHLDHAQFCYLLSIVKFSTKKYVVSLQKPLRYLSAVKSIQKVHP